MERSLGTGAGVGTYHVSQGETGHVEDDGLPIVSIGGLSGRLGVETTPGKKA